VNAENETEDKLETSVGFGATVKVTETGTVVHVLGETQLMASEPVYVLAASPAGLAVTVIVVAVVVAAPVGEDTPSQPPVLVGTIW
jgi:hypothetical protein